VSHCLDSWAVLEWLRDTEPAASRVEELLPTRPLMSWINLGEVDYVVHRAEGAEAASDTVRWLRPRLTLDLPGEERILAAAVIKATHPLAHADAFAVATALAHGAILVTGDPEILEADADWPLEDVR
jgi:predicted nucleic acid-binding protein